MINPDNYGKMCQRLPALCSAAEILRFGAPWTPAEQHLSEAFQSDRVNELAQCAKDECQRKNRGHNRREGRLSHREEDFMVRYGHGDVFSADERDYLLNMMESQSGYEIQSGIPKSAVDQRPGLPLFFFKE